MGTTHGNVEVVRPKPYVNLTMTVKVLNPRKDIIMGQLESGTYTTICLPELRIMQEVVDSLIKALTELEDK